MANTPDDNRFYKKETLLKVFGISSIIMMVFTIWMVLDDFGRDWKAYQMEFSALRQKKFQEWIAAARSGVDEAKLKEVTDAAVKADADVAAHNAEIERLKNDLVGLKTKEKLAVRKYQNQKAIFDVRKYEYEAKYGHKVAEGHEDLGPKAKTAYDKLMAFWDQVLGLRNLANEASQLVENKQKEIDARFEAKGRTEKELKAVRAEVDRLEAGKKATDMTLSRLLRSAPIVDMANPVLRINQIVLPTIRDDIYFAQVQKVDRCTTCHQAIDLPGFENEPQPFRTHPKLDLMLGSRSPHPMDKIGCTVCHEGRGQATHFTRTAHTPRNEEQELAWKKKHHWHEMHHVIEKMIPLQYTEGKCRTCHKSTEYVPRAEKLNASVQLIKSAGCYGCHRIEGWDHIRKPAPSLKRVKGKLTRDWIVKWVRNPKSFNDHARMPATFNQSNITLPEHKEYQEAEVHAISDYILSLSDDYQPSHRLSLGNAERGKEIVGSVGCLGCHQINDFGQARGRFNQAPDLSTVGSKVSQEWLVSWLKNPKHYWEETTMPSLRLTDGEISDVAAYLMGKRNPEFEQTPAGQADLNAQKRVLREYLMRDPKLAPATKEKVDAFIAKLQPHEISLQLGSNAVLRYGCFGCHEIKGLEKTPGIGTELTEEGSKPVNKLDFGLMHLKHANYAWFHKKFENPRIFDKGLVKEYLDLLRMPNYEFDESERNKLVLAILGMTAQKVDPPAAKALNAHEWEMEKGLRVVHKYNCQGCHVVEAMYTPLPEGDPNKEEHDKTRFDLEGRVLRYYEEDETLGPPPLVTQGARVQTDWVHGFVQDPGKEKLRARLKIRMPNFNLPNDELNSLLTYWGAHGKVSFPYVGNQRVSLSPKQLTDAKALFNRLQCLNCHTLGERLTEEQMEGGSKGLAPDLTLASKRLRKQWIVDLLKDPQTVIPGTRMPGFWPEMQSPAPDIMEGNSEAQIDLLADYILYLGQSRGAAPVTEATPPKVGKQASKSRKAE